MRTSTISAVATGVVVAAAGCSDRAVPGIPAVPFTVRDSAGIEIAENGRSPGPLPWTVGPNPTAIIGDDPGNPDEELYRVNGAMRLGDGTIVIGNGGTNELLAFSARGEFAWRAGGTGEGPGEFSILGPPMLAGADSLAAGDARLARVSVFDGSGRFSHLVSHPEAPLTTADARFRDGSFLTSTSGFPLGSTGPTRVERQPVSVHRIDPDGSVNQLAVVSGIEQDIGPTGGVFEGEPVVGVNPRPFGTNSYVIGDSAGWIVADGARPEIQLFDPTGEIVRLIRWEFEPRPVTAEDVEAFREASLSRIEDPVRRNRLREAYRDRPPPPEAMPYFGLPWRGVYGGGALVDGAGGIWLKEFIAPWEMEPNRYMVFERTGRWLGTVDVPVGLSVLSVGEDYLIGRRVDELGVETVEMYELTKAD